ncbi:MAG: DNA adenine methylase [Candidatus Anstonellales archaeon]
MLKPILRYVGSKRDVYQRIYEYFPEKIDEYREPMVGSGAMLIGVLHLRDRFKKIQIGDIDKNVYMFWDSLINKTGELKADVLRDINIVKSFNKNYDMIVNFLDTFGSSEEDTISKYLIYNRIRVYGNYGGIAMNSLDRNLETLEKDIVGKLYGLKNLIGNAIVRNEDYRWALQEEGENVLVFLDPPYYNVSAKDGYYLNHNSFDFDRLKNDLIDSKHRFIMTIDVSEFSKELKKHFNVYEYDIFYKMASKWVKECIVTNF